MGGVFCEDSSILLREFSSDIEFEGLEAHGLTFSSIG